jgi:hypothetical protein
LMIARNIAEKASVGNYFRTGPDRVFQSAGAAE